MRQQHLPPAAPAAMAPGEPIGYAPVYGAAPLPATPATATPPATQQTPQSNAAGKRWLDGFWIGGLVLGLGLNLVIWGVMDSLYAGKDIRALERRAVAANAEVNVVEQRAANAEANAQEWQQHSQAQREAIKAAREVLGCPQ